MRAAVALRNVVRERQNRLVIAVVPPQRDFDTDAVFLAADHDRLGNNRRLGAIEIAHERGSAALVHEFFALDVGVARIGQHDLGARVQKRQLAQAMLERRIIELHDVVERLGARQERHFRAALALTVAGHLQRRHRDAVVELDEVLLALAPDPALEPRGQRVDDGHADAVQTARHLVGILVELAACVQLGEHDLGGRALGIVVVVLLDARRDAAAIVAHGARTVGVERHLTALRVTSQNLVDGVVDDLVNHVMQARAVVGVADVHAGALADGVEALQHLDAVFAVVLWRRSLLGALRAHETADLERRKSSRQVDSTNRVPKRHKTCCPHANPCVKIFDGFSIALPAAYCPQPA